MKRVYGFFSTALWVISLAAVYFIFLLNFIYNASVSYDAAERVTINGFLIGGHLAILVIAAAVLLLAFLKKYLRKIHPQILFGAFTIAYTIMAIYLILNVDHSIRADAGTVFSVAKGFAKGDYTAFFKGGYIERYPQQAGLLFYDSLLQLFTKSTWISFAANFCFVIGINYFILKIAMLFQKSRGTALITVVLSFAFLPQFFFILFAYGLIPGFFFTLFAFYHAIRFTHFHKIHNAVLAIVGASVSVTLKQNFLIAVIAVLIYWLLNALRSRKKALAKTLVAAAALGICFSLPMQCIQLYYEQKTGADLSEGTPAVLWIAMGTDLDNTHRAPGWYSGFNYTTYTVSDYDPERATELGIKRLKENLAEIKEAPEEALQFFKDKTISQWCEPMYQSVWSGPLEACNQHTHTPLLQSIYNGEAAEGQIAFVSKTLVLVIFGFTLLFLLLRRKTVLGWELLLLFFIGGLIFHTFWEGKSQYIYPYVFCLIPTASIGMGWITEKIHKALLPRLSRLLGRKKRQAQPIDPK